MNWESFKKNYLLGSPLDLKKLIPDYFNKWLLRAGSLLFFFLLIYTLQSNGWVVNGACYECPENAVVQCFFSDPLNPASSIFLLPGQRYGQCPNHWAEHFFLYSLLLFFSILLLNHVLYFLKTGNLKPALNLQEKEKWKKRFGGSE